jgi:hypothetical protein
LPNSLLTTSNLEPSGSRKAIRAIIAKCLHRCAPIYKENLIGDTVAIYADALEDLSEAQINEGFNRCLRESKFWPRPSKLRTFCTGIDPTSVAAHNARWTERAYARLAAEDGFGYREGVYSSDTKPAMAAFETRQHAYMKSRPGLTHFTDFEPREDERYAAALASDEALAISLGQLQAPDIDEEER